MEEETASSLFLVCSQLPTVSMGFKLGTSRSLLMPVRDPTSLPRQPGVDMHQAWLRRLPESGLGPALPTSSVEPRLLC